MLFVILQVKVFFARLDEELNKVNQFHKSKETEFVGRGEILKKQLDILAELKQIPKRSEEKKPFWLKFTSLRQFFSAKL